MLARAPRGPGLFIGGRAGAGGTCNTKGRRRAATPAVERVPEPALEFLQRCHGNLRGQPVSPTGRAPRPQRAGSPRLREEPQGRCVTRARRNYRGPSGTAPAVSTTAGRPPAEHRAAPGAGRASLGWEIAGLRDGNAGADGGPRDAPAAATWGDGRLPQEQLWVPGSGPSVGQGRVIRSGPGWACRGQMALRSAVGVWVCAPPWRMLGGDQAPQDSQAQHWPLSACTAGLPRPLACPP